MKTIGCVIPVEDATSYYRGRGPISRLARKHFHKLRFIDLHELSWSSLSMVDAVFLQRPMLQDGSQYEFIREQGKQIFVDYDDSFVDIPYSNPCHANYALFCNAFQLAAKHADVSIVSTLPLAHRMRAARSCYVVPNSWGNKWREIPPRAGNIIWRGTNTHDEDLDSVTEDLAKFMRETLGVKLYFIGKPFWKTLKRLPENCYEVIPSCEMSSYHKKLFELRPKVVIAPLAPGWFNACKSEIIAVEATWAGALCVTSCESQSERIPGIIAYAQQETGGNPPGFLRALTGAWECSYEEYSQRISKAKAFVQENFDEDTMDRMRAKIFLEHV